MGDEIESKLLDLELSILSRLDSIEDKIDMILCQIEKQKKPLDTMENHVHFVESVGRCLFPFSMTSWRPSLYSRIKFTR